MEDPRRRRLAIAGTVLVPLLFYARATFSADVFLGRDLLRAWLPLKTFWAARVADGHFPGWYPYDGLGQPFVSMVVSGAFCPFNLVHLVLPAALATKWVVLACAVLSFSGAVFWARSRGLSWAAGYFAGAVFALSGYLVALSNNPTYLTADWAVPWVVAFGDRFIADRDRKSLLLTALFTCCIALAGDPMNFCVALAVLGLLSRPWAPGDRGPRLVRAGGAIAGSVALAAPQILPALALRSVSVSADQSLAGALTWSAHPLRLLEWWLGPVLLDERGERLAEGVGKVLEPALGSAWVDSQSVGALPVALAVLSAGLLLGRRSWPWLVAFAVLLLLWLGRFTPVGELAYRYLPLWKSFRYPEKLTPWLLLAIAAAGALLVDSLEDERRVREATARGLLASASVPLMLVATGHFLDFGGAQLHRNVLVLGGLSAATLIAAAGAVWRAAPSRLGWLLAGAVTLADFSFGQRVYAVGPADALTDEPELARLIRSRHQGPQPPRIWSKVGSTQAPGELNGLSYAEVMMIGTRETLRPAVGGMFGLDDLEAYFPARSKNEKDARLDDERARAWGAEFVISTDATRPAGVDPVSDDAALGLHLDRLRGARPRAWVQAGRATLTKYEPDEVVVDAEATQATQLWLSDSWYPGWTATVDGQPAPILLADLAVRGVLLSPGSHRVVFQWHTPGLVAGLTVFAVALVLLALFQIIPLIIPPRASAASR